MGSGRNPEMLSTTKSGFSKRRRTEFDNAGFEASQQMRQTGFPAATYLRESAASRQTLDSAQTPKIALRADPQAELSRFGIP